MSDLASLAKGLASQLAKNLRDDAKGAWDAVPEADKEEVEEVLKDWSRLTLRAIGGQNVTREIAHTKAQIASWKFVGAKRIQSALRATLKKAAVYAGKVILGLVV